MKRRKNHYRSASVAALPLPTYRCRRTPRPPTIDGVIEPGVWSLAEPVALRLTHTAKPPRLPTEARMLYDDRCLYIAFHCVDDDVWGTFTHRDAMICREEVVEVFCDPTGRRRSYMEIEISPLNTVYDLFVLNDPRCPPCRPLAQWNCRGLRTAVHVERAPDGGFKFWSCEIALPMSQMYDAPNLPPKPGDRWAINLYRIDRGRTRDEYGAWSPTGAINYHRPERFGHLVFLADGEV